MIYAWATYVNVIDTSAIEGQILWLNQYILISNKPIIWLHCVKYGLLYVHQLFEEGQTLSIRKARQLYNLSFLELQSLITAIPLKWKKFFKETPKSTYLPLPPSAYDLLMAQSNPSNKIYTAVNSHICRLYGKKNKWESNLNIVMSAKDYACKINKMYKVTNSPKLRSFQYRLMQRAIVTNKNLCEWRISENALCSFCENSEESIIHLFVDCQKIKDFYVMVLEYINDKFHKNLNSSILTATNLIFNDFNLGRANVVEFIILLAKQYIYRTKCKGKSLSIYKFKYEVNLYKNIEKYIALKNDMLSRHIKKWGDQVGESYA